MPLCASGREARSQTYRLGTVATVFHEHRFTLETAAAKLTRDRAEAHDLIQDAAERALRCAPLVGEDDMLRWLCAVMRNLAVDRFRQQKVRVRALAGLVALESDHHDSADEATLSPPEWSDFSAEDVLRAVEQLDPPFRRVFELSRELPLSQVAAELGIHPATVGTRLFRARRKLRQLLLREFSAARRCA